jgi:hypothetical protein
VKETVEVRELRSKILGMEMELIILSKDLERFKIELLYNTKMLEATEENIDFLKTSDVVVSIGEYKKIKQQHDMYCKRVVYYKTKVQPLEQILEQKEDFHKKEIERFEKIYRLQFKNNILEFPHDRRKEA